VQDTTSVSAIRKSHARFGLLPKSMTLDDLKGCQHGTCVLPGHYANLNEDRRILTPAKI